MADLPSWILKFVAAVEEYEYVHPKQDGFCLAGALDELPAEVRAEARGYARARRELDLGNPLGWTPEQIRKAEERSNELDKLIGRSADG